MKLYVARHGETTFNVMNKVCGITDVELTEKGINQAKELAKNISTKKVDLIISSPLKRAINTSKIVAEYNNIDLLIDNRLIEQNYGSFEGTDRNDQNFLMNRRNFAYRFEGGESLFMIAQRVYNLLEDIKEKYNDKNILLVCHGGVCRIIHTYFNSVTNDEYGMFMARNAELIEYEW